MKPPDDKCASCTLMTDRGIWNLCLARDSEYTVAGHQDWHTVQHMRTIGSCGPAARFYKKRDETKRDGKK